MRIFIVHAHHEPTSFNAAMTRAARNTLAGQGHRVIISDLHAMGFDPLSDRRNFTTTANPERLKQQDEEALASRTNGYAAELQAEMDKLDWCDLLIFQFPLWWLGPPAILKGWIDRVFAPDAAYGFIKGIDQGDVPIGLLATRVALVINTGNTPLEREREAFGDPLDRMWRDCILRYCGVGEVMRALFGVVATSSEEERRRWLVEAATLAERAAALATK